MPRGLRDLIAYGLSYAAQAWAYMTLLTDRYPSSDPLTAIGPLPAREDPIRLESSDDLRRNRLTVFFRLLLAIPHLIWLALWGIAALFAAIGNWFATLFTGTRPAGLHRFLASYTRYQLHVVAYLYLVGNPFPGFAGERGSYPIEIRIAERAPQNRWTVGFRLVLALPACSLPPPSERSSSPSPSSAGSPRCSPARCRSACATPAPWACATRRRSTATSSC